LSNIVGYLKQYWKFVLGGFGIVVLLFGGFLIFRVLSFIGDTTGGGRTTSVALVSPTADVPATATAQARYNELFGTGNTTPTPANAANKTPAPNANPTLIPTGTAVPVQNINSKVVDRIRNNEPLTFMFLGYSGIVDGDSPYLTDSILIMRFDPKTKTIAQFSIPRDVYVFVPYNGQGKGTWTKINVVFSLIMQETLTQNELDPKYRYSDATKKHDAAANLVADTLEPVLNLKIDHWATLNYQGFRTLIDALGTLDVYVDRAFIDRKYPKNDNDKIDASVITIEFKQGWQKMDGETAIRFSRSRNSDSEEGGDFARSRRQMKVITAIKDKVLKENLFSKGFDIMNALQGKIRFSLNTDEILGLFNYFNSAEGKKLVGDVKTDPEPVGNTPGLTFWVESNKPNLGYILLPANGQGNYSGVHSWVKRAVDNADIRRENLRVQVFNSSGKTGLATKMTDFLVDQGFRLSEASDGSARDDTVLMDYSQGQAAGHIKRLQTYIPDLKVEAVDPAKKPANTFGDLHLFLGKNFKGATASAQKP
jgi:LCP family protein required for cell wall assembly